ncbi:hypothetical protein B4102_3602 [Heyndrickxia sporothermodurans]|uniref:Phage protein n=1 Tax=Heyndrickxia sporothermodurans TaxID=46224 RepID=A0A150KLX4_9BACI|nr:hypothetical protein [Heyndrickxia sporothermodurans]KYC94381.1 hypothetical protein B4102_3602 [Heyndrickxia sporothermodurans]
MNPTLRDQLKQLEKQHKKSIGKVRTKPKKRKSEVLTEDDLRTLMGVDRPVYRRAKGGAWRNR